jgi:2-C-methyl-D-erythritol 4-phosphate cytidylyltransferase
MVEWSIAAFRACESVRSIVVAAPPGHEHNLAGDDLKVIAGGATRSQSVANALALIETELVAIHDAARPHLTPELVDELVARLENAPEAAGVIAAAPITDTVKQADSSTAEGTNDALSGSGTEKAALVIGGTLDRSRLWAAQTPQVFRTEALRVALETDIETRDAATDEATLVEAAGGTVLIHPTSHPNPKVTTPLDLRLVELLLTRP